MSRMPDWKAGAAVALFLASAAALVTIGYDWRSASRVESVARALTGGDPERAPALVRRYGCGGCHSIAGIGGADGLAGPPLTGLRQRVFIGGHLRNTPEALAAWIVSPQAFSPQSAMPTTGISAAEARDVAAYLYAH